jgi:hypothetical protein
MRLVSDGYIYVMSVCRDSKLSVRRMSGMCTDWSDESRRQPHVLCQSRLNDAICGALVRLHYLARLFPNDVGMLDDTPVGLRGF